MSGWLTKAKQALGGGRAPDVPEVVELLCECGAPARAVRKNESQRIICSKCGTKLYIFPKTCYPVPPSVVQLRLARAVVSPAAAPIPSAAPAATKTRGRAPSALPPRVGGPPERLPVAKVEPPPEPSGIALREHSAWGTRLQLTIGLIGVVFAATAYFVWNATAKTAAERRFQAALTAGRERLAEGQLNLARSEFADAVAAANFLNRDDREARRSKQLLAECTAVDDLLSAPFEELIRDATKYLGAGRDEEWSEHFVDRYGSTWLVFDTMIARTANEDGASTYEWQHPMQVGSVPLRMVGNVEALNEHFEDLPSLDTRRVVIAVQPDRLRLVPAIDPFWELRFNAATGFLWAYPETLSVHWGAETLDALQLDEVLGTQRALLDIDDDAQDATQIEELADERT